jgi:hypothetical protein
MRKSRASQVPYNVSLSGSDETGDGSASNPWRTIQHAAQLAQPGWTINVDGTNGAAYTEEVSITSSGTAAAPIALNSISGQAAVLNFTISGSYWTVNNFDVSNQTSGDGVSNGYGIHVTGKAKGVVIENNYIHELCQEGIFEDPRVSHVTLLNNRIWRAEMAGINIDGAYGLVQGNEVWDTQQYPANAGGIYSVCSARDGADADGMRFFGQHQMITQNYYHDINVGSPTNPDSHTDCYQTWGQKTAPVNDITINANICRGLGWLQTSPGGANHIASIEGIDGKVGTVRFSNNLFSNMFQGIIIGNNVAAVKVWLNTIDHIEQEAVDYSTPRKKVDQIGDNIFFDVGDGMDSYTDARGMTLFDNVCIMRSGADCGSYPSNYAHISVNPDFVNPGDSTGSGADYHLQAGSPLLGKGSTVTWVRTDRDGVARPTRAYSIGAYQ